MKTALAKTAWLSEPGARLDATYHLSEGRQAKVNIESNGKFKPLASVTERIFLGGRFRRVYVDDADKGYPYLTASDMIKSEPLSNSYLSKKHTRNINFLTIQKGWILLSCSGSIGRTVYTNEDFEGQVGTHDLIRIIADREQVQSGYLYAFLSSKYGYSLLTQGTYGGVIQHIEPHHIANLPVPLLPEAEQKQIHEQIEEASILRAEANKMLGEADTKFIELLDLSPERYKQLTSPSEADTAMAFRVQAGQLTAMSLRARNFGKRLNEIVDVLSQEKYDNLQNVLITEPFRTGRFRQIASCGPNAVELLSQSDIFSIQPSGPAISLRTVPHPEQELVSKGMILVPGQGTLGENEIFGRARFAWGYLEGKMVAGHVVRFIPNEQIIDAGYLFAVLNSKLWFRIFRSSVYGTNLLGFIVPMLNRMPIPRFDRFIEDEIGQKVKRAYENRTKANELENTAILHIERTIESWQKKL